MPEEANKTSQQQCNTRQRGITRYTINPVLNNIFDETWLSINIQTGESRIVVSGDNAARMLPNCPRFDPNDPNLIAY